VFSCPLKRAEKPAFSQNKYKWETAFSALAIPEGFCVAQTKSNVLEPLKWPLRAEISLNIRKI